MRPRTRWLLLILALVTPVSLYFLLTSNNTETSDLTPSTPTVSTVADISDKIILYQIAGYPPITGPAAPIGAKSASEVTDRAYLDFLSGKTFLPATIGPERGRLVTSFMTLARDGSKYK